MSHFDTQRRMSIDKQNRHPPQQIMNSPTDMRQSEQTFKPTHPSSRKHTDRSTSSKNPPSSPNPLSFGNSYIDRYMADNLTIRSTNQRSSTESLSFVVDAKYDNKGRVRVDRQEFRDRLVESGVVRKQLVSNGNNNQRKNSGSREP
jgi:hypothetical protein